MQKQRSVNRFWIAINLICLVLLLIIFYLGKFKDWPLMIIIAEFSIFILFVVSLYFGFIKTNFWRLVHTKSKNLDEREMNVILISLKYSYSIFTIIVISLVYISSILNMYIFDVMFGGGLLYLAHILPAAIVGWNEKIS